MEIETKNAEHIKCSAEELKMLLEAQSERENKQLIYDIVVSGGRIVEAYFIGDKGKYTPPTNEEYKEGLKNIKPINTDNTSKEN